MTAAICPGNPSGGALGVFTSADVTRPISPLDVEPIFFN